MWALLGKLAAGFSIANAVTPFRRSFEHGLNWVKPNELLAPTDYAELRKRGKIDIGTYLTQLRFQGLDGEKAHWIFELAERFAGIGELSSLRRRKVLTAGDYLKKAGALGFAPRSAQDIYKLGEIRLDPELIVRAWRRQIRIAGGKPEYFDDLRDIGWSDDRIELLKKVTEFFPAPADLIRFAVREVYTPEIIDRYKMMEDLPPKFLSEAKKAGLPEEQAKNYWASHWILPSVGQGFEMLHRDVITKEDSDTLLRTLDIMPYWRDKLTQIAYRPFSRVDVRRMNKVGTLDRAGVKRAYLDIGYDEEKAEKMTEFTILYNEEPEEAESTETDRRKEELKGLTKTAVLKQYRDNLIDQQLAGDYLKGLGFTDEVIEFYIAREDYLREEDRVDGYIKAYHRIYVNGVIDYNKLIDLLGELNLPDANVQYLTELWDIEKLQKPSQPSKADLVRFTKKKIISLDTFKERMGDLGYSSKFVSWYIQDYALGAK